MASTTVINNELPVHLSAEETARQPIPNVLSYSTVVPWRRLDSDALVNQRATGLWDPVKLDENPGKVLTFSISKTGKDKVLYNQIRDRTDNSAALTKGFDAHFKRKTISGTAVRLHNQRLRNKLLSLHPVTFALYKALIELQGLTLASNAIDSETLFWGSKAAHIYQGLIQQNLSEEDKKKYSIPVGFDLVVQQSVIFRHLFLFTNIGEQAPGIENDAFKQYLERVKARAPVQQYQLNESVVNTLRNVPFNGFNFIDYVGFSVNLNKYSPLQWLTLIPDLHIAATVTILNLLSLTYVQQGQLHSLFHTLKGGRFEPLIDEWNGAATMRHYLRFEEIYDQQERGTVDRTWELFPMLANLVRSSKLKAPAIIEKKDAQSRDLRGKPGKISFEDKLAVYLGDPEQYKPVDLDGKRKMIYLSTITKNGVIKVKADIKPVKIVKGALIYPVDAPENKPLIYLSLKGSDQWAAIRQYALGQSGLRPFNHLFNQNWDSVSIMRYDPSKPSHTSFGAPSTFAAPAYQQVPQQVSLVQQQFSAPRANQAAFDWNAMPGAAVPQQVVQPMQFQQPQPVQTFAQQPVQTFAQQPVQTFAQQPVQTFAQQPVQTFAQQPVQTFAQQPVQTFAQQPPQTTQQLFSGGVDNGVPSASSAMQPMNAFAQGQFNNSMAQFLPNPPVASTSPPLASPPKPSPNSMAQSVMPAIAAPAFTTTSSSSVTPVGNAAVGTSGDFDA